MLKTNLASLDRASTCDRPSLIMEMIGFIGASRKAWIAPVFVLVLAALLVTPGTLSFPRGQRSWRRALRDLVGEGGWLRSNTGARGSRSVGLGSPRARHKKKGGELSLR